jgi:hypothetical protein
MAIWIYSLYSQPPGGYSIRDYNSPILLLENLIRQEGEHIILGDFNLHHPIWSGIQNPTIHEVVEPLVHLITSYDFALLSPREVATWEARGLTSIIDLIFGTKGI